MDEDKIERTMLFILEQQAHLTVSMGELTESLDRLTEKVDKVSDKVDRTAEGINSLLVIAEIHDREIAALRESVSAVSESVNAVSESVSAVDERGRETDERLNALINTVERYISERRNGNS